MSPSAGGGSAYTSGWIGDLNTFFCCCVFCLFVLHVAGDEPVEHPMQWLCKCRGGQCTLYRFDKGPGGNEGAVWNCGEQEQAGSREMVPVEGEVPKMFKTTPVDPLKKKKSSNFLIEFWMLSFKKVEILQKEIIVSQTDVKTFHKELSTLKKTYQSLMISRQSAHTEVWNNNPKVLDMKVL